MTKRYLGTILLPGSYDPVTVGHLNSLRFLAERSERVIALIMTLREEEKKRWIPSKDMKKLIEEAAMAEGLYNVTATIEDEGWLAHSIDRLNATGVARSFHPHIQVEQELDLIYTVTSMEVPVLIIPSQLHLRASEIRLLAEEGLAEECREQLPPNVYEYIRHHS